MKTTLHIDNEIMAEAASLTGITDKAALVQRGLETLIAQERNRRLTAIGETEKNLKPIPRRRNIT